MGGLSHRRIARASCLVLLIEPDHAFRERIATLLLRSGYPVAETESIADAITVLSTASVRLVLLSHASACNTTSPLIDSLNHADGRSPVILLADVQPDVERLTTCGARDWLSSTSSPAEMIDQIDRWCGITPF